MFHELFTRVNQVSFGNNSSFVTFLASIGQNLPDLSAAVNNQLNTGKLFNWKYVFSAVWCCFGQFVHWSNHLYHLMTPNCELIHVAFSNENCHVCHYLVVNYFMVLLISTLLTLLISTLLTLLISLQLQLIRLFQDDIISKKFLTSCNSHIILRYYCVTDCLWKKSLSKA